MADDSQIQPHPEPPPPPPPSITTPLLLPQEDPPDTHLNKTIKRLHTFLCLMGFHQPSLLGILISWVAFLVVGVLVPSLIIGLTSCSGCTKYMNSSFEFYPLVFQASLAAVSLMCVSHNLRKRGLRRFLFVDRENGHTERLHGEYAEKIQVFFRLLIWCTSPCFFLKIVLEVVRNVYMYDSWWKFSAIVLASVLTWTYLTTISLSACLLFHLVCNLQVIHFDDYGKFLESDSDVLAFLEEHMCLKHYLSKISHRFRIFLLLEFFLVTVSQLFTLFQTTGDHSVLTVINGGNFAVIAIAQVVGIVLSLHAAAKISHRAQGLASVASRWHALVTCGYTATSQNKMPNCMGNVEAATPVGPLSPDFSESDLESLETLMLSTDTQVPSYHKRQAFVMYLQSNAGGITVFGWTIDRAMINTVFVIELSLVTFVLGKTIIMTA